MGRSTFLRVLCVAAVATVMATGTAAAVDPPSPKRTEVARVTNLAGADALRAKLIQDLVDDGIPAKAVTGRTLGCGGSARSARRCRAVAPACRPSARGGCAATVSVTWDSAEAGRGAGCVGGKPASAGGCAGGVRDAQLERALATLAAAGIPAEDVSWEVLRCDGAAARSQACRGSGGRVGRPRFRWALRLIIRF